MGMTAECQRAENLIILPNAGEKLANPGEYTAAVARDVIARLEVNGLGALGPVALEMRIQRGQIEARLQELVAIKHVCGREAFSEWGTGRILEASLRSDPIGLARYVMDEMRAKNDVEIYPQFDVANDSSVSVALPKSTVGRR